MEYPAPQLGASLVLAFRPPREARASIVLLSPTRLTATRALMALEAGYQVWIGSAQEDVWDPELAFRLAEGQVHRLEWTLGADAGMDAWAQWFDGLSDELRERCSLVGLGDTLELGGGTGGKRSLASAQAFMSAAHRRRYLVNVADRPTLSDFSYPTTHRFPLSPPMTSSYTSPSLYADAASLTTASKSPLQVVVLTNSSACRLATRIKREIVAALPSNIGDSVAAIAHLRAELALEEDAMAEADGEAKGALNVPVRQLTVEQSRRMDTIVSSVDAPKGGSSCRGRSSERHAPSSWTAGEIQRTRMRYVAQISEYWPLDRLSSVTLDSLSSFADSTSPSLVSSTLITSTATSHHSLAFPPLPTAAPSKGRIILLGTGPGNPLLLTRIAHLFLTTPPAAPSETRSPFQIDLFLTDKLVPSSILALLPPGVPVFIARKYPGNASAAQEELMALAIQAAQEGKTVCRMKQGDPFLFGRGGEELLRFREHGFDALVVPGLSSSIGGPTVCGIPVTQRGVAESVVICTAVRQGGTNSRVEQYVRGKTLVLLMGVGRIREIVEELRENGYPDDVPVGILERATCIDQRVLESTLKDIAEGVESSEGRPPGMIVVGWGVMCLQGTGDMGVIKDACGEGDAARVKRWLGGERWKVRDGLGEEWRKLEASGGN